MLASALQAASPRGARCWVAQLQGASKLRRIRVKKESRRLRVHRCQLVHPQCDRLSLGVLLLQTDQNNDGGVDPPYVRALSSGGYEAARQLVVSEDLSEDTLVSLLWGAAHHASTLTRRRRRGKTPLRSSGSSLVARTRIVCSK